MAFNKRMDKKNDRVVHHASKSDRQHSFSGRNEERYSDESSGGRYTPPSENRFGSNNRGRQTDDQRRTEHFEERTGFGARAPRSYENRPNRTGRDFESNNDRNDRPRFGDRNERPSYSQRSERPSYGDRSESSQRPSYSDRNADRPRFADRQERSFGGVENFDVVCAKCGKHTTVPFRPTNGRPVLCRDCFRGNDSQSFERPRFEDRAPRENFERSERSSADRPSFDRAPKRVEFKPRAASQQFAGKRGFGDKGNRFDMKNAEANWKGSTAFSESKIAGVFEYKGNLYTKNMIPGEIVYGERTFTWDGVEYRQWDPMRSKLGAGIKKGVVQTGITAGCKVLYLGCSTGTTVSHVSEIIGEDGIVYALDVAPRVMRDMVLLAKKRHNIYPIMFDANRPTTFSHAVPQVDTIFMDIAQSNQTEIFLKNVHAFLKPGGYALLSLKSRSVDITKTPTQLFNEARAALEKEMTIVDFKTLDPFEKDHALFVCKKK